MRKWILAVGIVAALSPAMVAPPAQARAAADLAATKVSTDLTATEVSFAGTGGETLPGTILRPVGAVGRRPGLVMLEGAGERGRAALRPAAEALARHGIVVLIYDKRKQGYSLLHRDYTVLAADALAAVRVLRARDDVEPDQLGLWALSEGAFVAPLAAKRSRDIRFVITVGAVGPTPAAQTGWGYGESLDQAGVSGSLPHTMQVAALRMTVDGGLFPQARFDPTAAWRGVRQPVLLQWGGLDHRVAPADSMRILGAALADNPRVRLRVVPGLRHDLNVTEDGGFDRTQQIPADYGDYEATWIAGVAAGTESTGADPAPAQDEPSQPVPAAAWYERAWLHLVLAVALVLAFLGYLVTARLGRSAPRRIRRPARWLAGLGVSTVVGFAGYLFYLLATAAEIPGPVVAGRTVPWLLLWLMSLATVAATVTTMAAWRRYPLSRMSTIRLGLLIGAGLLFIPWAGYWGLLLP